jgi:hypothetical protein
VVYLEECGRKIPSVTILPWRLRLLVAVLRRHFTTMTLDCLRARRLGRSSGVQRCEVSCSSKTSRYPVRTVVLHVRPHVRPNAASCIMLGARTVPLLDTPKACSHPLGRAVRALLLPPLGTSWGIVHAECLDQLGLGSCWPPRPAAWFASRCHQLALPTGTCSAIIQGPGPSGAASRCARSQPRFCLDAHSPPTFMT